MEKHLTQVLEQIEADFGTAQKIDYFSIIFGFLYSTSPQNGHFGFLRKSFDFLVEKFVADDSFNGFLVKTNPASELLLVFQEFCATFSEFIPAKIRLPLFQYNLTKFYMARDAQNTPRAFAIVLLLRCLSQGIEAKILKAIKPLSLLDSLVFADESEYSPALKQTLTDLYVRIVGTQPDIAGEIASFCVILEVGQNRCFKDFRARCPKQHRRRQRVIRILFPNSAVF